MPRGELTPQLQRLLATRGMPLIIKLAREYAARNDCGLQTSDFLSAGQIAASEVTAEYDDTLDVRYTTFLQPYVRGAMRDLIRRRRYELGVESAIQDEFDLAIAREGRRFAATQSDRFEVLFDPPEMNRQRLDASLSTLASRLAAAAAETAMRLRRRGTEEHLSAIEERARIMEITVRTLASLSPAHRLLWQLHVFEGKPAKEAAAAAGVSEATARRYRQEAREAIQRALAEEGIHGIPDVE